MGNIFGSLKSIGKILLVMYGITAVLLFLLALLVQKLQWGHEIIAAGISLVYGLSCFAGGFVTGKVQRNKKFLWGILIGFVYLIVMLVVTLAVKNGFQDKVSAFVINLLLCVGGGMLGGMLA